MTERNRIDPDFEGDARAVDRGRVIYISENSFQKWVMTGLVLVVVMGIGGSIAMYGRLSSIEAQMVYVQAELISIKRLIEPRYRNGEENERR